MNERELLALMEQRGSVLHGHFVLSSGRHSDVFVQKFRVLEDARLTQQIGELIADSFSFDFDAVASPAVGAVVLGFATALAAGKRFVFAERVDDRMEFRRGFGFESGERVLVVEDVITTGGSASEVVAAAKALRAEVIGIGALIDRADAARSRDLGAPLRALVTLPVSSWDAKECPLCASNEPVSDPGSRRLRG